MKSANAPRKWYWAGRLVKFAIVAGMKNFR